MCGVQPQTFVAPLPPQVFGAEHEPQSIVPPHPSGALPQFWPAGQLVVGVQPHTFVVPPPLHVFGGTHVPQTIRTKDATYINVGSWAEHEDGEQAARTHLVIHPTAAGVQADFCRWGKAGPQKLTD